MKVLVTGGAGFIGSHLSERLLREGHRVTIVDELNEFYPVALKRQNLHAVRSSGVFSFCPSDICDEIAMERVMQRHQPDAVIHLASRSGVRPSLDQPLLYEQVNVRGTLVLLEACRKLGIRRFIFASSSSVYGVTNQVPFREDDPYLLPISPYAATKLAGEKLCYTYSHLYGINTTCLRFFTVYGPRQRPDLAIRKFTELIAQGKPISVFGDGSTRRDYTFIDDILDGIMAALHCPFRYEVINLGNSNPVDLLTLIRSIEENLACAAQIIWSPEQPGDVPITYADTRKAARLLDYSPRVPLSTGMRKFVDWYLQKKCAMAQSTA